MTLGFHTDLAGSIEAFRVWEPESLLRVPVLSCGSGQVKAVVIDGRH
jgi:hypothetical protein